MNSKEILSEYKEFCKTLKNVNGILETGICLTINTKIFFESIEKYLTLYLFTEDGEVYLSDAGNLYDICIMLNKESLLDEFVEKAGLRYISKMVCMVIKDNVSFDSIYEDINLFSKIKDLIEESIR